MASNDLIVINDYIENIEEQNGGIGEIATAETGAANNIDDDVNEENDNNEGDDNIDDENVEEGAVEIPFEFTVGLRVNSKIIYTTTEKQLYRKDKKRGAHSFYYRCKIIVCPVRLCYNSQLNKCTRSKTVQHTHGDQEKTVKEAKLRKSIKDECGQMAGSSKRNKTTVSEVIYSNIRK